MTVMRNINFPVVATLVPILTISCWEPKTRVCDNNFHCPADLECVEGYDRCATLAEIHACQGKLEGESCSYEQDNIADTQQLSGVCYEGICAVGCGNNVLDPGEVCDGSPPEGDNCVLYEFDMGTLRCSESCDSVVTRDCELFGWKRSDGAANWQLGRAWGTSSDNIYVAGAVGTWGIELVIECTLLTQDCGRIFHYNGQRWTAIETHSSLLTEIWGTNANNMYAVGFFGTILHSQDGVVWTQVYAHDSDNFAGIWGSGPDDIFVIGVFGTILHYDGTNWSEMPTPPGRGNAYLTTIWGSGPADVYVGATQGLIWHYDGNPQGEWVAMDTGTDFDVNDMWGTGPDNVIASGKDHLLLHYDGNLDRVWRVVQEGVETDPALTAIFGISAREIYVAGNRSALLRYNSTNDEIEIVSKSLSNMIIMGAWGASGDDFWAVGADGAILQRTPSFNWRTTDLMMPGGIHGLWGEPVTGEMFAIGDDVWHRRDGTWTAMAVKLEGRLLGVWGHHSTAVFAVSEAGEILRYDGFRWSKMNPYKTYPGLRAVWGRGANDVFIVGEGGIILHYDGNEAGRWVRMQSEVDVDLNGVWGAGTDDVYAVGDDGTILHYDGNEQLLWTKMKTSLAGLALRDVWVDSTHEVFVVGDSGMILRHDGRAASEWEFVDSGTVADLRDIWGDGINGVYVAGLDGRLLYYDGIQWTRIRASESEPQMYTIWGTSNPPTIAVAGENGLVNELQLLPR